MSPLLSEEGDCATLHFLVEKEKDTKTLTAAEAQLRRPLAPAVQQWQARSLWRWWGRRLRLMLLGRFPLSSPCQTGSTAAPALRVRVCVCVCVCVCFGWLIPSLVSWVYVRANCAGGRLEPGMQTNSFLSRAQRKWRKRRGEGIESQSDKDGAPV